MSLPLVFGTTLATVPAAPAYLAADPARLRLWQHRLGGRRRVGRRIGLVWSGNPDHGNDRQRSVPLHALRSLLSDPGMGGAAEDQWIALQNTARAGDRDALALAPQLQYFGDALADFDDTAALAALCDLVIAVDTSAAHPAGAMGRPLWLLLPFVPDWRWLLDRCDSPWYPSARLYRQTRAGQWDDVLQQLSRELAQWSPETIKDAKQ